MTDFRTPMQQAQVESTVATGDWSTLATKSDEDGGDEKEGAMGGAQHRGQAGEGDLDVDAQRGEHVGAAGAG